MVLRGVASRIRRAAEKRLHYLKAAEIDARLWLTGKSDPELPPLRLREVGTGDFRRLGQELFRLLVDRGGLRPSECVLDIGCGAGRVALPLTRYLTPPGSYEGFDVDRSFVRWCSRNITSQFPHFRFRHVNIGNAEYKLWGKSAASFVFPYTDGTFDLVFATSVFTHFLLAEVRQYLFEAARVLRPGGRLLATFFLLNEEVERVLPSLPAPFDFRVSHGDMRFAKPSVPAWAVAVREETVKGMLRSAGFANLSVEYGQWAGRPGGPTFQDLVVASLESKNA